MSVPRNETIPDRSEILTHAGVLEESRNKEVILQQKVKDENLYILQNKIEDNREYLGLPEKFTVDRI